MSDDAPNTTPEQHLRRMIWPYDGEKDKEALRWALDKIERLRDALWEIALIAEEASDSGDALRIASVLAVTEDALK